MFAGAVTIAVVLVLNIQPLMASRVWCAGPIRDGANSRSAKLIRKVEPVYPSLARQAGIQGAVRFYVLISKTGIVERAQLEAGHPFLVPAALEAVKQYRYEPATSCGHLMQKMKLVEVWFRLNQ